MTITWTFVDEAGNELAMRSPTTTLTPERSRVCDLLRNEPGLTPMQISDRLKINTAAAKQMVRRMLAAGQIHTDGSGRYTVPNRFLETDVIHGRYYQVLAQEVRATGNPGSVEMRVTLRTVDNGAALKSGRRWLVIRAYEVVCDGAGEALTMPGRHLGSKALYAGADSADAEAKWERLSAVVPQPPVGS